MFLSSLNVSNAKGNTRNHKKVKLGRKQSYQPFPTKLWQFPLVGFLTTRARNLLIVLHFIYWPENVTLVFGLKSVQVVGQSTNWEKNVCWKLSFSKSTSIYCKNVSVKLIVWCRYWSNKILRLI